jgi:hypothetical protein
MARAFTCSALKVQVTGRLMEVAASAGVQVTGTFMTEPEVSLMSICRRLYGGSRAAAV